MVFCKMWALWITEDEDPLLACLWKAKSPFSTDWVVCMQLSASHTSTLMEYFDYDSTKQSYMLFRSHIGVLPQILHQGVLSAESWEWEREHEGLTTGCVTISSRMVAYITVGEQIGNSLDIFWPRPGHPQEGTSGLPS